MFFKKLILKVWDRNRMITPNASLDEIYSKLRQW
jgi:hypothetical protein